MEKWLSVNVWNSSYTTTTYDETDLLLSTNWITFLNLTPFLKQKLLATINCIDELRQSTIIYPDKELYMRWSHLCEPWDIKVVILGQDPYHGGQANGLAFSVSREHTVPPSLKNIYKELQRSLPDFKPPSHGCLDRWAQEGVLLLNTTLTVEQGKAGSHLHVGWSWFTNHIISQLSENLRACCFLLWGSKAIEKANLISSDKHLILKSQHPSPLAQQSTRQSQYPKFIGNNHFVEANIFLQSKGLEPVSWKL